jgi:outer membrane receptor protein involved in Fe transport
MRLGVDLDRLIVLALAGVLLYASAAGAQTIANPSSATPAQATQPSGAANKTSTTVQPVTVTAKASGDRRYIDRRSYGLSNDVQATNGSLADALRNIPQLDVDPQGNLSIRGDTNVTVLVDGQPSALFQGANLADVLQQLPADQYERVEVITNPSAAFKPDGSGGVINLITKKSHPIHPTGTLRGSIDNVGRYRGSLNGSAVIGPFTITGGVGFRRSPNAISSQTTEHLVDPTSGETAQVTSNYQSPNILASHSAHAAVDDALDENDKLSANISYYTFTTDQPQTSAYASSATTGPLAQDYNDIGLSKSSGDYVGGGASYRRQFSGDDHNFVLSTSYGVDTDNGANRQTLAYQLPVQPNLFQDLPSAATNRETDVKAEYKAPMPGQGRLDVGYSLEFDQEALDHQTELGTAPINAVVQPQLNDRFTADQAVNDLFATYQQSIGNFDIQPGLRLEAVHVDTDQISQGAKGGFSYLEAYPTLHLGYKLGDKTQFILSYSRRVQRPNLLQLDAFRVYASPLSFSQGNARLQPAITDSYEAGYEYSDKSNYYLLTLFYRDQHDMFTSVSDNLAGGVILATQANIGHNRTSGAEVVVNQQVTKTIALKFTTDAYWDQLTNPDPGVGLPPYRSGTVINGHGSVNWDITPKDFLQMGAYATGRQVTAQGTQTSSPFVNIGYRHKFTDKLSLEVVAINPTGAYRQDTFVQTPTLSQETHFRYNNQGVSLGFSYALGGAGKPAAAAKDFDFGGGGGAGH